MDDQTARTAVELTSDFYDAVAGSFSETRSSAWPGWHDVLRFISDELEQPISVLDVACGNMRFERFLDKSSMRVRKVCAVDNCAELAEQGMEGLPFPVDFHQIDIMDRLDHGDSHEGGSPAHEPCLFGGDGVFDLAVCFGFMHHIPQDAQRRELLKALAGDVRAGGMIAVSFWQFAKSEKLLLKAQQATERAAELLGISFDGENDYLLGWQNEQNSFRYCHNYTEDEIDELIGSLDCVRQIARFSSDGSSGNLNRYVVLEAKGFDAGA